MNAALKYVNHILTQKRYSPRTADIYERVLEDFMRFVCDDRNITLEACSDADIIKALEHNTIRAYQMDAMQGRKLSARTSNLHLSVLSGFCRFLMREGVLKSNPASLVARPKQSKRLPVFYSEQAMQKYIESENAISRRDFELELSTEQERKETYMACLNRIIVLTLYSTGMRRAELISLRVGDVDFSREKIRVRGKGDKMREIPVPSCLKNEIELYLHSVRRLAQCDSNAAEDPLLVTWSGEKLYPMLVDRAVKAELGPMGKDFSGRKSPHVLRHTLATGLLSEGADLNSIKEVLGHANLAATQVYTHSSPSRLKTIYELAHPRAKKRR